MVEINNLSPRRPERSLVTNILSGASVFRLYMALIAKIGFHLNIGANDDHGPHMQVGDEKYEVPLEPLCAVNRLVYQSETVRPSAIGNPKWNISRPNFVRNSTLGATAFPETQAQGLAKVKGENTSCHPIIRSALLSHVIYWRYGGSEETQSSAWSGTADIQVGQMQQSAQRLRVQAEERCIYPQAQSTFVRIACPLVRYYQPSPSERRRIMRGSSKRCCSPSDMELGDGSQLLGLAEPPGPRSMQPSTI
ncbi:uncharacterized protein CLUP02_01954 [Colletotrichum lupini]|uniref:Uncharacterized protein n=1 Tax=Colletotrichum lupini TaxID=145971 RepID=A0A9Q8SDN9_9PEZI|nr:uncharacterized protein CLUP02_01954 [Colletotrichum lupini]UQC75300.1 hypothetical protein CLUP02_01954 [Colletotrichum lupini]